MIRKFFKEGRDRDSENIVKKIYVKERGKEDRKIVGGCNRE